MPDNNTNATVITGVVTDDVAAEFRSQFVLPKNNSDVFTDYQVRNRYEENPHRYMAGISSPNGFQGSRAAFFQLAYPTILWICDWTACRWNTIPEIPPKDAEDDNWVFLFAVPETVSPVLDAVGGVARLYRISGTYVYGHKNPPDVFDLVNFPRPPWMQDNFQRTVPSSAFEASLKSAGQTNVLHATGNGIIR